MERQFCVQCGIELKQEDKFCSKCGAPVRGAAIQSRASQTRTRKQRAEPSREFSFPLVLAIGGVILLVLVAAWLIFNSGSSAPIVSSLPEDSHDAQGIPYPEVPRISLAEAKARYDARTAFFVDVRSQGEYDTAHIPNAKLLSLADLPARYRELPTNQEILTYCT